MVCRYAGFSHHVANGMLKFDIIGQVIGDNGLIQLNTIYNKRILISHTVDMIESNKILTVIGRKGLKEIRNSVNHVLEIITQWSAFVKPLDD